MTLPDATLVAFVYDERPTLNLQRSLIRDARRWPNLAIWDQSKDALISRMRSVAAEQFLEQGAGDVLIMVDHDIGWEAGDLEHLTRVCLDMQGVVGGVFPKRGFGIGVPIRFGQYGEYTIPDDRVVECAAVATGFMAIHRRVLEAMAPELPRTIHGWRPFFRTTTEVREDGQHEYLSEDYSFCSFARSLGFRVWADLRPQLTHMGTHLYTVADSITHLPPKGQTVVLQMKDITKPCVVQGYEREFELWIDPDDHTVSAALIAGRPWEPETMEGLAPELRASDTVLEIGSHIGYHTVQIAALVQKVMAVEPLPHLGALLRKNIDLHGLSNVEVWPMAVVAEDDLRKSARMLRDYSNPGASHLLPADVDQGVEVFTSRLPDFGPFDVLKLDSEGAEYLILNGERSRALLAGCRVVVFEYCEAQLARVSGVDGDALLDLLEGLGFDTGIVDRTSLPKGGSYCNILAKRREYNEGA